MITNKTKISSTPSGKEGKKIDFKSAAELQKELGKENQIDTTLISKYFEGEKVVTLTQKDLDQLKNDYSHTNLDTLLSKKSSILEQAQSGFDDVKKALGKGSEINKKGADALAKSGEKADDIIMKAFGGDVSQKITKASSDAMESIKKEFKDITSKGPLGMIVAISSLFGLSIGDDIKGAAKIKAEGTSLMDAWKSDNFFPWLISLVISDKAVSVYKKLNPAENEKDSNTAENSSNGDAQKEGKVEPKVEKKEQEAVKPLPIGDQSPEINNLKKNSLSKIGFNFMKVSTGVEINNESQVNDIGSYIFRRNYSELKSIFDACVHNGKKKQKNIDLLVAKFPDLKDVNGITGDKIFDTLSIQFNEYAHFIYSQKLNPNNIKTLLQSKKSMEYLGEIEYSKINNNYDYKVLNINSINILLTLSISSLFSKGVKKLEGFGINIYDFIAEDSKIFKELQKDVKDRTEKLAPPKVISVLQFNNKITYGGPEKIYSTKKEFLQELEGKTNYNTLNSQEKEKLINIIEFKEELLVLLKDDSELNLDIPGFDTALEKGIHYGKIISLYTACDGNIKNYKNDILKRSVIHLWIIEVLSINNNSFTASDYKGKLFHKINDSEENQYFNKTEKLILQNMAKKGTLFFANKVEKKFTDYEGIAFSFFRDSLMNPLGIHDENIIKGFFRLVEAGFTAGFLYAFKKVNIVSKFIIGSSFIGSVVPYIFSKVKYNDFKKAVGDNMFKSIEEDIIIGKEFLITDSHGKTSTIIANGAQDIYDAQEDMFIYNKRQSKESKGSITEKGIERNIVKKKTNKLKEGEKVYYKHSLNKGLIFTFEGNNYQIDTLSALEDNKVLDYYNGKNVNLRLFNENNFIKNGTILLGEGENTLKIEIDEIIKALTQGQLEHLSSEGLNYKGILPWVGYKGADNSYYKLRGPLNWDIKKAEKLPESIGEIWDELSNSFKSISNSLQSGTLILRRVPKKEKTQA